MGTEVELRGRFTTVYAETGNPSGVPVLLLHGYADSHRFFEPVLPHLDQRLRILAVTGRGHGAAGKPDEGYDLATLAGDVVAFLDAVNVERAVLVGHSSGGYVAQQVAVDQPERVLGLLLVGAPADLHARRAPFAAQVEQMREPVDLALVSAVMRTLPLNRVGVSEGYLEEMLHESAKMPAWVWREALAGLVEAKAPRTRDRSGPPTLVVWGDADPVLDREDQDQLAAAWDAELVVVSGVGHLIAWEVPERLGRIIERFALSFGPTGS